MKNNKTVALMYNIGSDFYHNRIHYANYLQETGYDVTAILPNDGYAVKIKKLGLKVFTYDLPRNSMNPFSVWKVFRQLKSHFKKNPYAILHTFRLQPNIIGTLAFNKESSNKIVCTVTGLGLPFSNEGLKSKLLKFANVKMYQLAFSKADAVVVQNSDDFVELSRSIHNLNSKLTLIRGSGVNPDFFNAEAIEERLKTTLKNELKLRENNYVVTFVSRLLWQKGVDELIQAAEIVNAQFPNTSFLLVGDMDEHNPSSVNRQYIEKHNNKNGISFLGRRSDVKVILSISNLYAYPSYYREGIPRSVLEAMSMGLPIITTESTGCKETVDNGLNGYKVPVKNGEALANAIIRLIQDKALTKSYGVKSRKKLINEFSEEIIFRQFAKLYCE